jgi:RNA polymerase sigma-70 factor (ECF subfamily)
MNSKPATPGSVEVQHNTSLSTLRSLEDAELAAELAAGDHDALTVLFERHSALVFRVARRMLRNDGEAEETVQQVFLDVYRAMVQFDIRKGSFKTWLLQFAYHRAINRREHLLAQRFYEWEELDDILPELHTAGGGGPLQQSPQELGHLLEQLLSVIKPQQRKVIELTFFHGLTAEEIAKLTGETPSVVRHNLYRGMSKLRSALLQSGQACKEEKAASKAAEKSIVFAYRPPTL